MNETKQIALLTALETGSITAAAEKLGYTQSGLSYIISTMEKELGFPLFHRSRTGVRPTAECQELLPLLEKLKQQTALLGQKINEIRGLSGGTLSLATYTSISRFWLPNILRTFTSLYPDTTINLREQGNSSCLQALHAGEADLALISRPVDNETEWLPLYSDEILVVLPEQHPLTAYAALSPDLLENESFTMVSSTDYDVWGILDTFSFAPNIRISSTDELLVLELVRSGMGITLMSEMFLSSTPPGVVTRPLVPRTFRELGIACIGKKSLSPAAHRFLELVKQTFASSAQKKPDSP